MATVNLYKFISSEYIKSTIQLGRVKLTQLSTSNDPLEFIPRGDSSRVKQWLEMINDKEPLVLCLSPMISSAPMWAHYAENHQGAAIVFQFDVVKTYCVSFDAKDAERNAKIYVHKIFVNKTKEYCFLVKCIYLDRRLEIPISKDELRKPESRCAEDKEFIIKELWFSFLKMVSVKGKEWEYEHEYRLMFYDDEQVKLDKEERSIIDLFRDNIRGIVLGFKKHKSMTKAKVKRLCPNGNIEVDTAYLSDQKFEIKTDKTSDSIDLLKGLEQEALDIPWEKLYEIMH